MDTRTKWNTKHQERLNQIDVPTPNPRLKNLFPYLLGGTALDLACGLGGNSLLLERLNYQVQAVDISEVAINFLQERASKENLNIMPRVCDLTEWNNLSWEDNSFDLVVISYYLDRSLFPILKNIIKEEGFLFMETYYLNSKNENQGVSHQYKLQSQELLNELRDWQVLFFEENEQEGRQTIFAKNVNGEIKHDPISE
ncbi:class I SAM-dependent methyltransferase [Neobacillus niacini]|uniref:class I SAM-dependent methyltransferase n=1 Tax=Neobacillus niacini TaxID=86668 RepID=UPI002864D638|nr:class I SAM-dependent methyltransferase [Neobacillus niacini]MDR6999762.1 SAM-dependent methyltransferase [Neobacillus niacini]